MTLRKSQFILLFMHCIIISLADNDGSLAEQIIPADQNQIHQNGNPAGRTLFSPRVDYNEWLPVGRADPLKNDPTFDYSPPVLDRVRYWGDTNKEKKDILLLGVPSKRTFQTQPNQAAPGDGHPYNNNRRNFYMSEPATVLMPPPMPNMMSMEFNNHGHSGFNNMNMMMNKPNKYWGNGQHINDALIGDSNGFLTVLKPKFVKSTQQESPSNNPSSYLKPAQSPLKKTQWLHSLLQKEVTQSSMSTEMPPATPHIIMSYSPTSFESHTMHTDNTYNEVKHHIEIHPMIMETTTHFTPTTAQPLSMTTDELFSHYKQPVEPLKGPMYLIIQGHSKVKTYGPKPENITNKHVPKMVPVVSTKDPVVSHVVSEDDNGNTIGVMHLHKTKSTTFAPNHPTKSSKTKTKNKLIDKKSSSTMDNLLSLLDTSFGGFFSNDGNSNSSDSNGKIKLNSKKESEKSVEKTDKDDSIVHQTNGTTIAVNR